MTRSLFLDFDGTLVDSRVRQHELFVELTGNSSVTLDEYWKAKREGYNQSEMLARYTKFSPEEKRAFSQKWLEEIEDRPRLLKDELIDNVREFLGESSRHFSLYIVTGRQHRDRLVDQLHQYGILHYFSAVLNTAQRLPKAQLVRSNASPAKGDAFIGDGGEDILAGRELGIFTVGVSSGSSTADRLGKYGPDLIVNSVAELDFQALGVS